MREFLGFLRTEFELFSPVRAGHECIHQRYKRRTERRYRRPRVRATEYEKAASRRRRHMCTGVEVINQNNLSRQSKKIFDHAFL
ncbi:hypothetical protein PUN28_006433 [Cardiocondyla obscurior]|uniref:Uncharacterized protein n=1 Tax=Cardiocondyla obscurior TaxID=286306 RepID=A0AAW2GB67_9HYME